MVFLCDTIPPNRHATTCRPFLAHFIQTTHQLDGSCPGHSPCDASGCGFGRLAVQLLDMDPSGLDSSLRCWLQRVMKQPRFPAHTTFRLLASHCVTNNTLATIVTEEWMHIHQPYFPPTHEIRGMFSVMGSGNATIRRALCGAIRQFFVHPNPDALDELELVDLAQMQDTLGTPDGQEMLSLAVRSIDLASDPLALQYSVTLWKFNLFDIGPHLGALLPCLRHHPRTLERAIQITWTQCQSVRREHGNPYADDMLVTLLNEWVSQPWRILPTATVLSWDTAITLALATEQNATVAWKNITAFHDAEVHATIRSINQCTITYAFAITMTHGPFSYVANQLWGSGTKRGSKHKHTLQTAMPPRLAAMCPLDGITCTTVITRLNTAFSGNLRTGHRILLSEVRLAWWISWIGYLILFLRLTDGVECAAPPALPKFPVITIVSCIQYSIHDNQWQWIQDLGIDAVRWRRQVVSILIQLAPLHHTSLFVSALRWLADSAVWGDDNVVTMRADRYEWSCVHRCVLTVPCAVLLEESIITMIATHRHPPIVSTFLARLQEVPMEQWTESAVQHLFRSLPVPSTEVDAFVWATFFQPKMPRSLHAAVFSIHPHCAVRDHWCHFLRLHSGMPNTTSMDAPQGYPLQRIACNHTQPGDLGILLDQLTTTDNRVARRWVAAAFGHNPTDEICATIPWDTIVCWIIGNVVIFTHQSGYWEMLPDAQQQHIGALLLQRGNVPEYSAWFLRALVFHADIHRLCLSCYQWWWRHGRTIIPSLVEQAVVLLPCLPRLAIRCESIVSEGGSTQMDGAAELTGSVVVLPDTKDHRVGLLTALHSILPGAPPIPGALLPPGAFRALFFNCGTIWTMIHKCVAINHWDSVAFLVKSDIDGWLQRLVANDTLQPFTQMMQKLVDEPRPLSLNIQSDFAMPRERIAQSVAKRSSY